MKRIAYSVQEVAEMLGASPTWCYARVYAGDWPSVKIGGLRRILASDLKKILKAGEAGDRSKSKEVAA